MGLERVTEQILARSRQAAEAEVAKARKDAAEILADARKQADAIKAKRAEETARAVESLRRREAAAGELEIKKLRLNAQKEVLARLRDAARERLASLPADKRAQYLKTLSQSASLPGARFEVAAKDAEAARKAGILVAGTVDALGGLVAVSTDGALREDLTYDNLFEEVWTTSLPQVAETLFGKQG